MKHVLVAFAAASLLACSSGAIPAEDSPHDPPQLTGAGGGGGGGGGAARPTGASPPIADAGAIVGAGGTGPGVNPAIAGNPGAPGNIGRVGNEFGGIGSDAAATFPAQQFANFDFDF